MIRDQFSPDTITVAITRVDGGVTVMKIITAEYASDGMGGRTKVREVEVTKEYVEKLIQRRLDSGLWTQENGKYPVEWETVPNDYITEETDRTYRNAWKHTKGERSPGHDMVKARNVHRELLRGGRTPLLDALDIEYQKASEAGDEALKRDVAGRKQRLRDVTADPRIEAAQSVEELKNLTLEELS